MVDAAKPGGFHSGGSETGDERVVARTKKKPGDECAWREDSSGEFWQTSCEEVFCFLAGGPKENKMQFCCYCGIPLRAKLTAGERMTG